MKKNFRITVDGRSYNVVVEDLDSGADPGQALAAAPATAASPVEPAIVAAPVPTLAPAGIGSIVAPLGGVVISIDVALGHDVAAGDRVATIEAMKMQTEVLSKVTGKVTNIAARRMRAWRPGKC